MVPTMKIIDLSSNNHETAKPFNYHAVRRSGVGGVIIKCTQGLDYVNPWLHTDAIAAHNAGLLVGYYHYAIPRVGEAVEQMKFALKAIECLPRNLGLATDLEVTNGLTWPEITTFAENCLGYLSSVHVESPLYSNEWFLSNMHGAPFAHKLWMASPGATPPKRKCWMWQNSWTATIKGIPGAVDTSIYIGE